VGEFRRYVLVFVGPQHCTAEDGGKCDSVEGLVRFAKRILGFELESTMNLPLTTKVKIDTVEGPT